MTGAQLVDHVASLLEPVTFPIVGPNEGAGNPEEIPGVDLGNATQFAVWEPDDEEGEYATNGHRFVRGQLSMLLGADRGSGDLPFHTMRADIEKQIRTNIDTGVTFYPTKHGEILEDENFAYRRLFVPYLRQQAIP